MKAELRFELKLLTAAALAIVLILASCQNRAIAREEVRMEGTVSIEGRQDFDFLVGEWEVANRRLKQRHVGSTDWEEFPGRSTMRPVLGGLGNVDEIHFPTKGWSGATLRFFNPEKRLWSIYWVNSRDGLMQAPVHGAFRNGVGEFYGEDLDEGRAVRVRYLWSMITKTTARWEQAFSTDGDKTWETNWVMDMRRVEAQPCCRVVELRQYTLKPGQRDTLVELFEREFIEGQERHGMRVIGQFRDIDRPDRFVWLRGFTDMPSRRTALTDFYGGPVWAAHRTQANATMEDVSNVLLLRPASEHSGIRTQGIARAPVGAAQPSAGIVVATLYHMGGTPAREFTEFFERAVAPELLRTGAYVAGRFVTEEAPNDFPKLPVREGERVFAWFGTFENLRAYELHLARLEESRTWREETYPELRWYLRADPEVLRLAPTPRSLLRPGT
jgi:hypothetical protein